MAGNFPDYVENGRLYHGYRKGIYMFPCDEVPNPSQNFSLVQRHKGSQTLD